MWLKTNISVYFYAISSIFVLYTYCPRVVESVSFYCVFVSRSISIFHSFTSKNYRGKLEAVKISLWEIFDWGYICRISDGVSRQQGLTSQMKNKWS